MFPIPNYDINKNPVCKKYIDMGFHNAQFNFRLDETLLFQGESPSRNSGQLQVTNPPKGHPVPLLSDMPNEHRPGLSDLNS